MIALLLSSCGAGAQWQRCGFADACASGLRCVHGGPERIGTCERPCADDTDCPASTRCELEPPPDALHHVCVAR